jgi:Tfp pilus assembly protein PilN
MLRFPFKQHRAYLIWFKLTCLFVVGLVLFLGYLSLDQYYSYQALLAEQALLQADASRLDEIVSKKNKLLAQADGNDKYVTRKASIHHEIKYFLTEIAGALATDVHLDSFEFSLKKIELTGYSYSTRGLSDTIANLQRLAFVKGHEIEYVAKNKDHEHKMAFTVVLDLH